MIGKFKVSRKFARRKILKKHCSLKVYKFSLLTGGTFYITWVEHFQEGTCDLV